MPLGRCRFDDPGNLYRAFYILSCQLAYTIRNNLECLMWLCVKVRERGDSSYKYGRTIPVGYMSPCTGNTPERSCVIWVIDT